MLHCTRICSGIVELIVIVIVQAQHINNRKCSNSHTINVGRQFLYRFCNVMEMRSQTFKLCNLNFSTCFKLCRIQELQLC